MIHDEFLMQLSHEIRTPLTSIMALAEALLEGFITPLDEKSRQALQMISNNAQHLLDLSNALIQMSSMEPHWGHLTVANLLPSLRDVMLPLAQEKGLQLSLDAPGDLSPLYTDRQKLQRILVNLLSNAIKFTDRGSVKLQCIECGKRIHFIVRDTGRGMTSEQQARIFEPFIRFGESQGYGLGLAISHRLAQQLQGTLRVESVPGRGSTFTLDIPRQVRVKSTQI